LSVLRISRLTRFVPLVFLLGGCAADRWDTALRGPVGQIDQRIHHELREAYKSMELDRILSFYTLQMPPGWSVRDHPVAKQKQSILDRFDRIEHAWVSIRPISIFDYDNDGYLDIYVLGGGDFWKNVPSPVYQARNGTPCRLFRNNGNWTFTDVTRQAGVGDTGWGQAVAATDYDNDADLDIYIANGMLSGESKKDL
jgi:hypothetical protein